MMVDDGRGYRKNEGQRRIGQKKSNSVNLRGLEADLSYLHFPSTLSLSLLFTFLFNPSIILSAHNFWSDHQFQLLANKQMSLYRVHVNIISGHKLFLFF
jgi:hypothetical protein